MVDVKELIRRWQAGESVRRTARESGVDRKTVRRYYEAVRVCGIRRGDELTADAIARVADAVQGRTAKDPSAAWSSLFAHQARIAAWLSGQRPLRLVRIHELLVRDGVDVSYNTLRRFAGRELGFGGPRVTVRLPDTPPGEEAQADFGHVGWLLERVPANAASCGHSSSRSLSAGTCLYGRR